MEAMLPNVAITPSGSTCTRIIPGWFWNSAVTGAVTTMGWHPIAGPTG